MFGGTWFFYFYTLMKEDESNKDSSCSFRTEIFNFTLTSFFLVCFCRPHIANHWRENALKLWNPWVTIWVTHQYGEWVDLSSLFLCRMTQGSCLTLARKEIVDSKQETETVVLSPLWAEVGAQVMVTGNGYGLSEMAAKGKLVWMQCIVEGAGPRFPEDSAQFCGDLSGQWWWVTQGTLWLLSCICGDIRQKDCLFNVLSESFNFFSYVEFWSSKPLEYFKAAIKRRKPHILVIWPCGLRRLLGDIGYQLDLNVMEWVVLILHFVLICPCPFIPYWDKRQQTAGWDVWHAEQTGGVGCVLS